MTPRPAARGKGLLFLKEQVCHSDTPLYKLSWREKYSEFTQDGRESIYGYYLKMDISMVIVLI